MKYHGCVLEFTEQRNSELMQAYRRAIAGSSRIDIAEVSVAVVNTPCSRFWVSEERAMVVVNAIEKGKDCMRRFRATKREMFEEIHRRVVAMRERHPRMSMSEVVFRVVNSPAPKFYMRPRCAMEIIYKLRKRRRH
jgi:hypothetical protein